MKHPTFDYETSIDVFGPCGANVGALGEIDIKLTYAVTSWGTPEQGPSYASGGEPAEGPEIEVSRVYMDITGTGRFLDAFPWLFEEIDEWAYEHIDELIANAGEELEGQREAAADAKYEEEKAYWKPLYEGEKRAGLLPRKD